MSDDFSRALARTAVGQLAELAGYEAVQESATDVLSELMIKYITELSATAHGYAELANRTGMNLHDLLLALDDLGTSVPELHKYLSSLTAEDNTFAHVLTDYPVRKPGRSLPTWHDKQEEPPPHIPSFLPAFPDKHTYQATPTYPGHETNPDKQAKAQQRARKQAEASLLKLHHATSAAKSAAGGAGKSGAGGAGPSKAGPPPTHPFQAQPTLNIVHLPASTSAGLPTQVDGSSAGPSSGAGPMSVDRPAQAAEPQQQQQTQQPGGGQGPPSTAPVVQGTGAYEPHAASKAFAPVLGPAAGGQGEGASQPLQQADGLDGDHMHDADEIMAPEELNWRFQARMDETGALKRPLGTSFDYTSAAFAATHSYTVGKVEEDAYEQAAKEQAAKEGGGGRSQRSNKQKRDPVRAAAEGILARAKDPTAAQDADE